MTQGFEQRRRRTDRIDTVWMQCRPAGIDVEQPDPEPAGVGPELVDIWTGGWRGDHRVADSWSAHRIEQPRRVAHRPADTQLHAESRLGLQGTQRDPPLRGFQTDQPATRRRDPDRAATIAGVGDRHHPGGHCCSRPAARTTRYVIGVPGVAGRSVGDRFGHRQAAELGAVGAPQRDQTGSAEPRDERAVDGRDRHRVAERNVAVRHRLPGVRRPQVLQQERHAAERSLGQIGPGGDLAGVIEPAQDDGVDRSIELLDPLDRRFGQLERRNVTVGDELGLSRCIEPTGVFGEGSHRPVLPGRQRRLRTVRRDVEMGDWADGVHRHDDRRT